MAKKLRTKKKPPSVSKLKKVAWTLFSVYIRLRDSDWNGWCVCYTCGKRNYWKAMQAGHFIPGRHNSILFDERGVHAQCYSCNISLHGNTLPYLDHMLKDYGQEIVDEMRALDKINRQFDVKELQDFIAYIKVKTELLNK